MVCLVFYVFVFEITSFYLYLVIPGCRCSFQRLPRQLRCQGEGSRQGLAHSGTETFGFNFWYILVTSAELTDLVQRYLNVCYLTTAVTITTNPCIGSSGVKLSPKQENHCCCTWAVVSGWGCREHFHFLGQQLVGDGFCSEN